MLAKYKEQSKIIKVDKLGSDIYSMWLQTEQIAEETKAGQFVSVYCKEGSRLLPRPISICEIDKAKRQIRLVYRIAGKGTEEFALMQAGETLEILGPLGNGFPLERLTEGKTAMLIGGGIGIPPMVELAKALHAKVLHAKKLHTKDLHTKVLHTEVLQEKQRVVLGYRDELFLTKELEAHANVTVATEDGSVGTKGNVLDAIRETGLKADIIYACGPTPMLRALKEYAEENKIECWLSLEERMACGIGACLACVCQSKEVDEHTNVTNKRVCKEGPVFLSTEVVL